MTSSAPFDLCVKRIGSFLGDSVEVSISIFIPTPSRAAAFFNLFVCGSTKQRAVPTLSSEYKRCGDRMCLLRSRSLAMSEPSDRGQRQKAFRQRQKVAGGHKPNTHFLVKTALAGSSERLPDSRKNAAGKNAGNTTSSGGLV